ncbi:succinate dehydrogenase cytochrome b subunit [Pseudobacter ginsenosidimutans]|uniref:Succinate dehydrogenase / fumarate reductase cytochrome b subunit n=1 Tax=Pseudobacter ginsenosidimutans TaxID=661488 RepID=A0A4Q7N3B4_9BACT|nr:succinate dehydrogenase cytochrome b subunit [Pseudobacter ginsenosidimutans]QEC43726.1 succinate dehydrogenase cytochrome b subunit [Pseudobacter ginsenosidimutans]RZS75135.1 succinate dehydrogenase / fumarate reductase cytochrome b subunit [Pseudobacter ginsenosidimutans]
MKWSELFTSSIGKKLVMGFTGIFLILFLIIHVSINACIFADLFDPTDNGEIFNRAAHFMGAMILIRIAEVGLFAGIILHIVQGYMLTAQNNSKRGVAYAVPMGNKGSKWYSRSMGLLGTLLLMFLVLHVSQFWWDSRISHNLPPAAYDAEQHDLFARMIEVFQNPVMVVLYIIACISLAYHLMHGFQSAFRTIGVHNNKYLKMVKSIGIGFSIIVPIVFALMPIACYFGWVRID